MSQVVGARQKQKTNANTNTSRGLLCSVSASASTTMRYSWPAWIFLDKHLNRGKCFLPVEFKFIELLRLTGLRSIKIHMNLWISMIIHTRTFNFLGVYWNYPIFIKILSPTSWNVKFWCSSNKPPHKVICVFIRRFQSILRSSSLMKKKEIREERKRIEKKIILFHDQIRINSKYEIGLPGLFVCGEHQLFHHRPLVCKIFCCSSSSLY